MFSTEDEVSAVHSTSKTKANQRATSRSRLEGIDISQEQTDEFERIKTEESRGSTARHEESRGQAVKLGKPLGVIINFQFTYSFFHNSPIYMSIPKALFLDVDLFPQVLRLRVWGWWYEN